MNSYIILFIIAAYFTVLLLIAWITGRNNSNEAFFLGDRKSPWYIVSIGMVGTSLSGVTFVSVYRPRRDLYIPRLGLYRSRRGL